MTGGPPGWVELIKGSGARQLHSGIPDPHVHRPHAVLAHLQPPSASLAYPRQHPRTFGPSCGRRFLFVVPFGGVGAATGAPIGVLRSRTGTRELIAGMREIYDIATALGVRLPDDAIAAAIEFTDGQPAAATSSLQRDIGAGQPSELESWTGAVVRLGVRSGTPTPVSSVLYELLSLREAQSRVTEPGNPRRGTFAQDTMP
jgi:ketopantoate reductase